MNDKVKLRNTIIKWSLYGLLMICTILIFAFSKGIFGAGRERADDGTKDAFAKSKY